MGHTVPKMWKLFIVVFSLGLISACVGQVTQNVPCNANIPALGSFNPTNYAGTWYDIESVQSPRQSGTCNIHSWTNSGTNVNLRNSQVVSGVLQSVTATAAPTAGVLPAGTAKYTVTVTSGTGASTTEEYWVLDTDYITFALVYSCRNVGTGSEVSLWKLGRNTGSLPTAANNRINTIINAYPTLAATTGNLVTRSHSAQDCYATVELPGACPTTVTGVTDFRVADYLGLWHEYARYPNEVQAGQCSRAEYRSALTEGVVIENTEVNGGVLFTTTGTATTTAQSGVLQVNLNVGGATASSLLYVLATDYDNYALVYSCTALPDTRRRINSWILRKTATALTEAQNTAIDEAISAVDGLDRVFYQTTSHTSEACINYPDLEPQATTVELRGPCATVTGLANFDVEAYLGRWHELARYPSEVQAGQCSRAEYTASNTPDVVNIENSEVNGGALFTTLGTARPTAQSGVLDVQLDVNGATIPTTLYVLATDYEKYALVYSCVNVPGNNRRVNSWILSKNTGPLDAEANTAVNNAIAATQGLDNKYYRETSHTSEACINYPELDPQATTVELRGPCATVTGVSDFNLNIFVGTWYEVARYPNTAQRGQCNRAEYGIPDTTGVITVENSEVIAEALSTTSGTASPTAQTGVLQVNLNVGGTIRSTDLYVLATDHTSYALLYSCVNVPGNNRRVTSWKLSKSTAPLDTAANTAINNAIAATQGLDSRYYRDTSQLDPECFYYPDYVTLPDTIELRGSCPTITGLQNFNLNDFMGTWYEVARYPQPRQTGQCNRVVYEPAASTGFISVVSSQVENEALDTLSAEARQIGQTGQFEIVYNDGDETRVLQTYVLATDYTNYALVYHCANIDGNRRRVSSWKLSKSRDPLTDTANAAINTAIAATQGLDNRYYQEIRQTNEACFYYPEFETPPATIELPGPCPTIAPVQNFDLSRFLGTWYEVARYPQEAQTGQCNRAVYEEVEGGGISVVNSQVTNEVLLSISGEARTTEQPGIVEVVFNVGGQTRTTNLNVLQTDYTNYALVYSCVTIDDGNRRRVGSWKLSRGTSPLLDESNEAIDAVISATQGLKENYYQTTNQNDAACFHYPPQTGEKVIIPGQCDTSISGVANIDLNRFTNELVWYQIKRYDAVVGTCIGTRLRLDEDYIHLNYVERVGDEVKRLTGVARLSSVPDGKFTFEMEDSEEQEEIYILSTDYDGFAIAYNCKNVGTNQRQIGAWQLSRERTMSAAGEAAVQQLISSRQEFTERENYFKEILHPSPAGDECPEPSSGFLFKSSIIVICVCALLQLVW